MIAIGIDPSVTHTGVVVLDSDRYVCESRAIKTKPVDTWQAQVFRIQTITNTVRDLLAEWGTSGSIVFMEDYAIGGGFPGTIIPQVELGGHLRLLLAEHTQRVGRQEVYFVAPTALKKFATGKGNANKVEVATSLMKRFGEDFKGDDDLWDAYGLARMALASTGVVEGLTQAQCEVVGKVMQPKVKKTRKGTQ